MFSQNNFNFDNCVGTHTFLYGETNTRKTYFTSKFIQFLLESRNIDPKQVSILDFAPTQSFIKGVKIGGKIVDFYRNEFCNKTSNFYLALYFNGNMSVI